MIAEFVLVLTLVAGIYSSPAVTVVHGFKTEQACLIAANTWLKQAHSLRTGRDYKAFCAKDR